MLPWPRPGKAGWKGTGETSDRLGGTGGSWGPAVTSQVRVARGSGHCLWGGLFLLQKEAQWGSPDSEEV